MAYQPLGYAEGFTGLSAPIWHGLEAAAQSWKIGALLVDLNGTVVVGAADPGLGTILGVATGKATGVTGADVTFDAALSWAIFEGNLDDTSGTYVSLATDLYARRGLNVSSGVFYVDASDSTNIRVCIVGFRDPVGTVNGRVYFVFLPNSTRFSFTAV
jgi:hypothetical protein